MNIKLSRFLIVCIVGALSLESIQCAADEAFEVVDESQSDQSSKEGQQTNLVVDQLSSANINTPQPTATTTEETAAAATEEWSKRYGKRLETIDGIEIASSYKEYIALALGDIKDRLKKSKIKLADIRERTTARTNLFDQVVKEITKRRMLAMKFAEKDRQLRKRLIRNTEMKSAIQRLAEIGGYKLLGSSSSFEKISDSNEDAYESRLKDDDDVSALTSDEVDTMNNKNDTTVLGDSDTTDLEETGATSNITNNSKVYIQMAYKQINEVLTRDKQLIVELIRKKKNNDFKLKELDELKIKVSDSLVRLKQFDENLAELIKNDLAIESILTKLSGSNSVMIESK